MGGGGAVGIFCLFICLFNFVFLFFEGGYLFVILFLCFVSFWICCCCFGGCLFGWLVGWFIGLFSFQSTLLLL